MAELRDDGQWYIGQHVLMRAAQSVVPPGTQGIVEAIYPENTSLAVRFIGRTAADIVGPEEITPLLMGQNDAP